MEMSIGKNFQSQINAYLLRRIHNLRTDIGFLLPCLFLKYFSMFIQTRQLLTIGLHYNCFVQVP